jgi:hypothetical protein
MDQIDSTRMLNGDTLDTFLLVVLLGYLVFYLTGRKYAENFQSRESRESRESRPSPNVPMNPRRQQQQQKPQPPYTQKPIRNLDEYEVSAVYQNQGSKEATKLQRDQAMAQYPMDWVTQGPASPAFQEGEARFQATPRQTPEGQDPVDPKEMLLPDSSLQEAEERKILQTYQPEKSAGLLYSVDDVKTLVEKLYDKRGLIPELVPSKQGPNVWEITEVREKNPTIIWEDDPAVLATATQRQQMTARGEDTIRVPYAASDVGAGVDPFYEKGSSRQGRFDYHQWTPGLERMFAPTYQVKSWF